MCTYFFVVYKNAIWEIIFLIFAEKITKGKNLVEEEISDFSFSFKDKYAFRLHFSFEGRLDCKKIITVRQVGYYFLCILQYYLVIIISSSGKSNNQKYKQMERDTK